MDPIAKDVNESNIRRKIETEFYNSFKKFIWVNQVCCAAPIDLGLSINRRTLSKASSVLHALLGVFICATVSFATYLQSKQFDASMGFMTRTLYMGEYIIGTFNLLLIIVGCQYQKRNYLIFFKRLINVDINLNKCGIQPKFQPTKNFLKRSMAVYTIFFAFVIVVDFMYNRMHGDSFVRSSTVYTIPNVISTLALTQYAMVLHVIRDKFNKINAILSDLISNKRFTDRHQMINKFNIISVVSMNKCKVNVDKAINILRKQHDELSRLLELLNKCFGLLIILILIAAYIILSTQFYAFYKMTEGFEETDIWLTAYTILWVMLHSGKVLLILYPINDVIDERKRTGRLLYQMDFVDSNAAKTFADQLLHETSPPNAMRVINLDLTIVGTMFGVLTTYLTILIQYDANARDQSKLFCNST